MKRRMSSNSILKHLALAAADLTIVNIAYFIMTLLHSNFSLSRGIYIQLLIRMPYISLIYIGLFAAVGLYRAVWKFAGLYEVALYVSTGLVSTVLTFLADYILMQLEHAYFPQKSWFGVLNISVYIDATLMIIGLCLFIRLFFRNLNARFLQKVRWASGLPKRS